MAMFWKINGGGKQIVLDPKDLNAAYVTCQRMPTNWGYDSGLNTGQGANLVKCIGSSMVNK